MFGGRRQDRREERQDERATFGRGGNATHYRQSLDKLAGWNPDIWLPAVPINGQNANLYGNDWANTIAQNVLMVPSGKQ